MDYFLKSLSAELIARRCEQLMKAAEKEVEQIELLLRQARGLPIEAEDGKELEPISLPKFEELQQELQAAKKEKDAKERKELEEKVNEIETRMQEVQERLRNLNEGISRGSSTMKVEKEKPKETKSSEAQETKQKGGAMGPEGKFLEFPAYDSSEAPKEWRKPFTHFCNHHRKGLKQSLNPSERKDKVRLAFPRQEYRLFEPTDDSLLPRSKKSIQS